jgi:D-alanyl-D-alanine carboxypeptidase
MGRIILGTILLFLAVHSANAQSFNSNLATKLQQRLDSLVTMFSDNTKGISASVYCPGQGIWKGVSGMSYSGHPLTTDMEFGIASNSKLFTAVTFLRLAEDNIISLNDPLSKWIPSYTNVNPAITIRQLLNHTSGVSDPFFTTGLLDTIQKYPTHVYTPTEILTWLGPQAYSPGTGYNYSNINYVLAGMVAKSATGYNISKLIRDYILTPLQLDSTFFDIEESETGTLAHRWAGKPAVDLHNTSRISLNTAGGPAGSIFSTAGDIVKWYHALMSHQVLNASSFSELTTFVTIGGKGNYGLGLQRSISNYGTTVWGHGGSTIGYKSLVIYDPAMQTTVCCLANADWAAVDGITMLLYKLLIDNLPAPAGTISGLTVVSQGQNSVTYTVPAIAKATSYIWTLPQGVTGTSSTNSITINYEKFAVSGSISVKGNNSYGDGAESTLVINVTRVLSDFLTITNLSLANGSTECFNAIDTITIAGGSTIVEFLSGSTVDLIAGQSIFLLPGFHAFEGNFTNAYITTTGAFCDGASGSPIVVQPVEKSVTNQSASETQTVVPEEKMVKVYPNPNNGKFTLELSNIESGVTISIYNIQGTRVYQSSAKNLICQKINLTGIRKGIYFVKVLDGKEQLTTKMIVN